MNPLGTFDEAITLCEWSLSRGPEGQKIETYTDLALVYAKVLPTVTEGVYSDNQEAKETAVATIYKRDDISSRWRVRWNNKIYNIVAMDMLTRLSPYMKLTIEEV